MASNVSPQDGDELSKLRRENERLRSRLDFKKQRSKQELEFQRSQDLKELEFERQQNEMLEMTFQEQLSTLKAERDGARNDNKQLRDAIQQLQDDKQRLQDENERLQDGRNKIHLVNTMLQEKIAELENRARTEGRSQESPANRLIFTAPINPPPNSQPTSSALSNKNWVPNAEKLVTDNVTKASWNSFKLEEGLPSPATPKSASREPDHKHNRSGTDLKNPDEDCKPSISSTSVPQSSAQYSVKQEIVEALGLPQLKSEECQAAMSSSVTPSSQENIQDSEANGIQDGPEHGLNPEGASQDPHGDERMDIDEVMSAPAVQVFPAPIIEACRVAIAHLDNPEVIRPAFNELPADVMYSRMAPLGLDIFSLDAHADILDQVFTRAHLSHVHGGSPMQTFPNVNKMHASRHGYERFMCVNLDYNPFAPRRPGAPGLYFALRDPALWPRSNEIVISAQGVGKWNVMGKYEIKQSTPLSGYEFQRMPPKVQNAWINSLYKYDWGIFTLANIYLRRTYRRDPTEEEVKMKLEKTSKQFLDAHVKETEIKTAFMEGREKVNVWSMTCIGYDAPFKRALITPLRAGSATSQPGGGSEGNSSQLLRAKSTKNARASSTRKANTGQKRQRSSSPSNGLEEDDTHYSDGSDDSDEVYQSRGTKSRPT